MKLRIGVFGAHRGMSMINTLMAYQKADLVAVCDRHLPSLEKVRIKAEAAGMDVALYDNFDDFFKHEMDAVILANYATEHVPFAVRCLNAGLHVMSECVPCETMAQAVELIEAVERSGKVYAYAENCCYMTHAFEMWQQYKKGHLGEVRYAEGEYIHDCAGIWPEITYGERNHWRNRIYATFYCTHSLGPILMATGMRPVQVVGYECPPRQRAFDEVGFGGNPAIEMVTLENGAVVKSIHGGLVREDANMWNFQIYCTGGMMESARFPEQKNFNMYKEGPELCKGTWERYDPVIEIGRKYALETMDMKVHGGADFYATYFFIEKILGGEDGQWSIDVYNAVDMGICGLLAWRSVLNGNIPVAVPNLRNPEERDAYRNDHACTTPWVAGDQLLPNTTYEMPPLSDEFYDKIRNIWLKREEENNKK